MGTKPQFVWADTGTLRIIAHGEKEPSDEEWARFLAVTVREVGGRLRALERKAAVIYSRGGMPSPRQRRELQRLDIMEGKAPTLVLMSDSRLVRGVATALGWVVPSLRHFHALSLDQWDEAAQLISAHAGERAEFKQVLSDLLKQLDGEARPGTELGSPRDLLDRR